VPTPTESVPTDRLSDVFGQVANERRVELLVTLWELFPEPTSFSKLQSAAGMPDSGKFNYHLGVLVPEFVRKTEAGYLLTYAGREAIGVAVSGNFTDADAVDVGPVPAGECMFCAGGLEAVYEGGRMIVTCDDCGELVVDLPIPPIAVSTVPPDRVPAVFSRHLLTLTHTLAAGFCKRCHGAVDARLTALSDRESVTYRDALDVHFACRQCGDTTDLNVGAVVMNHPAVVATLLEAGVDLHDADTYVWELLPLLDPDETLRVDAGDPLLDLRIEVDGAVLDLTVDGSASVVDYDLP
jgi:hypothetical protein